MCNVQASLLRLQSLETLVDFLSMTAMVSRTLIRVITQLVAVEADYRIAKLQRKHGGGMLLESDKTMSSYYN
jgi:hypothetical protein